MNFSALQCTYSITTHRRICWQWRTLFLSDEGRTLFLWSPQIFLTKFAIIKNKSYRFPFLILHSALSRPTPTRSSLKLLLYLTLRLKIARIAWPAELPICRKLAVRQDKQLNQSLVSIIGVRTVSLVARGWRWPDVFAYKLNWLLVRSCDFHYSEVAPNLNFSFLTRFLTSYNCLKQNNFEFGWAKEIMMVNRYTGSYFVLLGNP